MRGLDEHGRGFAVVEWDGDTIEFEEVEIVTRSLDGTEQNVRREQRRREQTFTGLDEATRFAVKATTAGRSVSVTAVYQLGVVDLVSAETLGSIVRAARAA